MYPEERLGVYLNSASMMWAMVDDVFEGVRRVMRDNGRARSGSLSMKWSATMQPFWQVILYFCINEINVVVNEFLMYCNRV